MLKEFLISTEEVTNFACNKIGELKAELVFRFVVANEIKNKVSEVRSKRNGCCIQGLA